LESESEKMFKWLKNKIQKVKEYFSKSTKKESTFITGIFLLIFATIATLLASIGNDFAAYFFSMSELPFAAFLIWVAFWEELLKFFPLRSNSFKAGLAFVLILSLIESLSYAFYFGMWYRSEFVFYYIMFYRWILNGHLLFYLSGFSVSKLTNRWKFARLTGKNYNIFGYFTGAGLHFLWNCGALDYLPEWGFPLTLLILALCGYIFFLIHNRWLFKSE